MKLHHLITKGLNPGKSLPGRPLEVEIDFDALGSGVIGVVGPNNAGKTSLLSACLPLPVYRIDPYYGDNLIDHLPGGGMINVKMTVVDRLDLKVERKPNADRISAWLRINDQRPLGANVGPIDAELEKRMASKELCFTTQFCTQGGRLDLWDLPEEKRRMIFLEMLMLDRYEGEQTRTDEIRLDWQRMLTNFESELQGLSIESQYDAARAAAIPDLIKSGRDNLPQLQEIAKKKIATLDAIQQEIAQLTGRGKALRETAEALAPKLAELRERLKARPTLAHPIEHYRALAAQLESRSSVAAEIRTSCEQHHEETNKIETSINQLMERESSERVLLQRVDTELTQIENAVTRAKNSIAGVDVAHPMCAVCPLTRDVRQDLDAHPAVKADAEARRQQHADRIKALLNERTELVSRMPERSRTAESNRIVFIDTQAALGEAQDAATLLTKLQGTEGLDEQIAALDRQGNECQEQLKGLVEQFEMLESARGAASEAATAADRAVRTTESAIVELEAEQRALAQTKEALAKAIARRDELVPQIEQARTERERFALLYDLVGELRDLRLNAAVPTIEREANGMLQEFWDGAWRITLETTSYNKKGKARPDFVPTLWHGARRAKKGCGGEGAIAKEALCLATAACNAKMGGFPMGTLFRDETSAALDRETASAYMKMLRGFMKNPDHPIDKLLLVSHLPTVQEQSDRIIRLREGRVERID